MVKQELMVDDLTTLRSCGAVRQERAAQGDKRGHPPILETPSTYMSFYEGGQGASLVEVLASWAGRAFSHIHSTKRHFLATVLLMAVAHKCMQRCSGERDGYLISTSEPFSRYVYTSSQLYDVASGAPI